MYWPLRPNLGPHSRLNRCYDSQPTKYATFKSSEMPKKACVLRERGDHLRTIEVPVQFQFIEVDDNSAEQKRKNRSIAHSHVKKAERRARRARNLYVEDESIEKAGSSHLPSSSDYSESPTGTVSWSSPIISTSSSDFEAVKEEQETRLLVQCYDSANSKMLPFAIDWVEHKYRRKRVPSIDGCLRPTVDLSYATALEGCFGTQCSVTQLVLDHGQSNMQIEVWATLICPAVSAFWPGSLLDPTGAPLNPLIYEWWYFSCHYTTVFHAHAYLSARHLSCLQKSTRLATHPAILTHKMLAIQSINKALNNPKTASSDAVILAIFMLACAELPYCPPKRKLPFTPPLTTLGWINVLSGCTLALEHSNAMRTLICMRGGMQNIPLLSLGINLKL